MAPGARLDLSAQSTERTRRTVDEHRDTILAAVRLLEPVTLPLADAAGYTLRAAVRSAIDLPPFDNSAMDGFAVRFADVAHASPSSPARLRVVDDLPAGTASNPLIGRGEAVRIMTGAPLPASADTVVPFEDTAGGLTDSLSEARVIRAPRAIGTHVRTRGENCPAGGALVACGIELGPLQLSAIAAASVPIVTVTRRPRVGLVATGDELVAPGTGMRRGQIPESNLLMMVSMARAAGAEVILQATVADVDDDLRRAIDDAGAAGVDAIITSGGVSAGAYEVVRTSVPEMTFVQVAMQPGRPQGFAAGRPLVFGLPGNPGSAAVSFELFVRPALLAMQGRTQIERQTLRLPAVSEWRSPPDRRQYLPIALVEGGVVPAATLEQHRAAGLARAAGYAVIPTGIDNVAVGELVEVMLLP